MPTPASCSSAASTERGTLYEHCVRAITRALRFGVHGLPLIGCGGIANADDAWERIRAGASLVQLYTAMVYEGPHVAKRIAFGLARKLEEAGYIDCRKSFDGRVPRTEYGLTPLGRMEFTRYLDHMEALIEAVRET